MKLIGNLKKQVEETNSKEEAKELIENAGMLLTDEELDNVTGGTTDFGVSGCEIPLCEYCGEPMYHGCCENPKCSCNNPGEKPDYK